jgi:hypothetical protein
MLTRVFLGAFVLFGQNALAYNTFTGITQCSGVVPGAKPIYFVSQQGDQITIRSSYSEMSSLGTADSMAKVSAKVNIQIFPTGAKSISSKVIVGLANSWSGQDCRATSHSGVREYRVQLKPCYLGNDLGFEGTIGGAARANGRAGDAFSADSETAFSIGYIAYCGNRGPAFGSSTQRIQIEINGRTPKSPVGEENTFGLTL